MVQKMRSASNPRERAAVMWRKTERRRALAKYGNRGGPPIEGPRRSLGPRRPCLFLTQLALGSAPPSPSSRCPDQSASHLSLALNPVSNGHLPLRARKAMRTHKTPRWESPLTILVVIRTNQIRVESSSSSFRHLSDDYLNVGSKALDRKTFNLSVLPLPGSISRLHDLVS